MKFKIFKFESVTSTNDVLDVFMQESKQKGEVLMVENGFLIKGISLYQYFFL